MLVETAHNIEKLNIAAASVATKINKGSYSLFNCMHENNSIKSLGAELTKKYKNFIVVGLGGSINAGLTFAQLKPHNITFIDNIEPKTTYQKLAQIKKPSETLVICISKSGKSEEVLLLYKILCAKFREHNNTADNFLVITQQNQNKLEQMALKNGHRVIPHDPNIGGRFSYLSVVGLLIATLAGLDTDQITQGAQTALTNYLQNSSQRNNYCYNLAKLMLEDKLHANIILTYHDDLLPFQVWFQQLWAESLGKNGLGSIPVAFSGTRDQHSQLQLYLASPKGKAFTMIRCQNFNTKSDALTEAYHSHADNVTINLKQTGKPVREIILPELNEYNLSYLMTNMVLDTLITAEYMQIDPFGQNKVEAIKNARYNKISETVT